MVALCCISPFQGVCSLWCQAYETYDSIFHWKIHENSSSSQDKSIKGGNLGLPKTHLFHQEQILSHVFFLVATFESYDPFLDLLDHGSQ